MRRRRARTARHDALPGLQRADTAQGRRVNAARHDALPIQQRAESARESAIPARGSRVVTARVGVPAAQRHHGDTAREDALTALRQRADAVREDALPARQRSSVDASYQTPPTSRHLVDTARNDVPPHQGHAETPKLRYQLQEAAASINLRYRNLHRQRERSATSTEGGNAKHPCVNFDLNNINLLNENRSNVEMDTANSNPNLTNVSLGNHHNDSSYNEILSDLNNRAHSTDRGNAITNNLASSDRADHASGDSIERLAKLLENSFKAVQQNNASSESIKLINRMTNSKLLPKFSGDPLEWSKFKREFEISTIIGGYSDNENLLRLCEALKGDAREAARSLFVAGNHTDEIMKTLEMRFGNAKLILNSNIFEIKNLPNISSRQISLIEFATRLKNAVIAIKSFENHQGYLYSPELVSELVNKLPNSMIS